MAKIRSHLGRFAELSLNALPTHQSQGWVAIDEQSGAITGRPWEVPPSKQSDFPPEGEWVSKKGAKSYVYALRYPRL